MQDSRASSPREDSSPQQDEGQKTSRAPNLLRKSLMLVKKVSSTYTMPHSCTSQSMLPLPCHMDFPPSADVHFAYAAALPHHRWPSPRTPPRISWPPSRSASGSPWPQTQASPEGVLTPSPVHSPSAPVPHSVFAEPAAEDAASSATEDQPSGDLTSWRDAGTARCHHSC